MLNNYKGELSVSHQHLVFCPAQTFVVLDYAPGATTDRRHSAVMLSEAKHLLRRFLVGLGMTNGQASGHERFGKNLKCKLFYFRCTPEWLSPSFPDSLPLPAEAPESEGGSFKCSSNVKEISGGEAG